MVETEQVHPLAPATGEMAATDDKLPSHVSKTSRRRKYIKTFGSAAVLLLIVVAIVIVTLIFTAFRVKSPVIKMNGFTITHLVLVNGAIPKLGVNMSLVADVSVKNPNAASFKYGNTTSTIYYAGEVVGEARGPPGQARAGRTRRMNLTVDIITDRILSSPNLSSDVGSGFLPLSSYARIGGRVNIWNIVKKHVTVEMNCTMEVNISSQSIQGEKCKRKVDL